MKKLDGILFDLGGVILNIDYQATISAFEALGIRDFKSIYTQLDQQPLFDRFETGKLTEETFFDALEMFAPQASTEDLMAAWNAMLLDLPSERWEFIQSCAQRGPIGLLSNTNETHVRALAAQLPEKHSLDQLRGLFQQAFFSNEIGYRKPDAEAFEFVLGELQWKAENTLFIDDSPQHIEGAKKLGMHTWHLQANESILDLDKVLQAHHLSF